MAQADPQAVAYLEALGQMPIGQQVVSVENNVAELDMDIIMDEGVDSPTVAIEQFEQLMKMAGSGVVQIPGDVLIEASSLKNKDQLLETMRKGPSPEQQQMQQKMQQLQMAGAEAEVEKTQSETAKNMATAHKTQVDTVTGAYAQGLAA